MKKRCSTAKERWLNVQCDEIQELANKDTQTIYERVKEFTGIRRFCTGEVIIKNSEMAMKK